NNENKHIYNGDQPLVIYFFVYNFLCYMFADTRKQQFFFYPYILADARLTDWKNYRHPLYKDAFSSWYFCIFMHHLAFNNSSSDLNNSVSSFIVLLVLVSFLAIFFLLWLLVLVFRIIMHQLVLLVVGVILHTYYHNILLVVAVICFYTRFSLYCFRGLGVKQIADSHTTTADAPPVHTTEEQHTVGEPILAEECQTTTEVIVTSNSHNSIVIILFNLGDWNQKGSQQRKGGDDLGMTLKIIFMQIDLDIDKTEIAVQRGGVR
ncbi:hypothetical protein ACJX0J_020942, partial [Zea mays]